MDQGPPERDLGTAGVGTASHIAASISRISTGAKFQFVPYSGTGPAMQDLMAGQIEMMFDQSPNRAASSMTAASRPMR